MTKKILVVGGAGYIGSLTNKLLQVAGYETVVLDNFSTGAPETIPQTTVFKGDITNPAQLTALFKEHSFDAVLHFAALTSVEESVKEPERYAETNVQGTVNLLEAMGAAGVDKFIFSSTAAIYDSSIGAKVSEEHPKKPINPYGISKLRVEGLLPQYEEKFGIRSCCLRFFNAAGADPEGLIPYGHFEQSNLIPRLLRSLISGSAEIHIFGEDYPTKDGTCVRDYIHIYDLGTAHILALEYLLDGGLSTQYNLGNGEGYTVKEVVKAVEDVTGHKIHSIKSPRREGDPVMLVADTEKVCRDLAWKPKYSDLHSIISHAWQVMPSSAIHSTKNGTPS